MGPASDSTVEQIVTELLSRSGHRHSVSDGDSLKAAGLTSEDGVELACDLEARLGVHVPKEVNPLLHASGNRVRTLGELKGWVQQLLQPAAQVGR